MILVLLCLVATALTSPLPPAEAGDTWLQVCCQDNDLNNNGGINFREYTAFALNLMSLNRAELERLFLAGDVDRNSELDGDECIPMRALLKSTLEQKGDLLMKKYDANKDGHLTEDEAVLMAKNEFGVSKDESFKEFILADQNGDRLVSAGNELSELMLSLRAQQISKGGATLSALDTNRDGKVSYEEIKPEILHSTDGFTLKQMFKAIDFNKDYHLTLLEYLALLNEFEIRKKEGKLSATKTLHLNSPLPTRKQDEQEETIISSITGSNAKEFTEATSATQPPTQKNSTTLEAFAERQIRARRDTTKEIIRVAPSRTMHEFQFDEEPLVTLKTAGTVSVHKRVYRSSDIVEFVENGSRRSKKSADTKEDTALPLTTPLKQLKKEQMKELSERVQHNLSGGGRTPTIDESVTVPYDNKDFQ